LPQILVINDDPGLLSVCSVGLQALGHTVRTAETGEEGISQAALHAPDVIVLDLGLPDLDGGAGGGIRTCMVSLVAACTLDRKMRSNRPFVLS
jgi:CheY-like chemotaxis protein